MEEIMKELNEIEKIASRDPNYNPRYYKGQATDRSYYEGYVKAITDLRRFITQRQYLNTIQEDEL